MQRRDTMKFFCWLSVMMVAEAVDLVCDKDFQCLSNLTNSLAEIAPKFQSWNESSPPCEWTGVTCNVTTSCVTAISIPSSQGLFGVSLDIFEVLLTLPMLVHLDISDNGIIGTVSSVWIQSNLTYLDLHSNSLQGLLPLLPASSSPSPLQYLDLSYNAFSGALPDNYSTSFPQLQYLSLHSNYIDGTLPGSWERLSELQHLDLGVNSLSGTLPDVWSHISAIQLLNLQSNFMTGSLPLSWMSMTMISYMNLNSNKLSGTLPDGWSAMSNIQYLDVGANQLSGTLPEAWSNLQAVINLVVEYNQFSGTVPSSWASLTGLQSLFLDNNLFTGTLPSLWSSMSNMTELDINTNMFSGPLPESWSSMSQMQQLYMEQNQFSGTLPSSWSNMTQLQQLYLQDNQLSGDLPYDWGSLTEMTRLYLANNHLSGTIPLSWMNMTCLADIDVSNNDLFGIIPISTWSSMQKFSAQRNSFTEIPDFQGCMEESCTNITVFDMSGNLLSGPLTPILDRLPRSLRHVHLASNKLSGIIEVNDRTMFQESSILNISGNAFSGSALSMSSFEYITSTFVIDARSNSLACPYPGSFENASGIVQPNIIFIRSPCVEDWDVVVAVYGIVLVALLLTCLFLYYRGKRLKRRPPSIIRETSVLSPRSASMQVLSLFKYQAFLSFYGAVILSIVDVIAVDIPVFLEIQSKVNQRRTTRTCSVVNSKELFFPLFLKYNYVFQNGTSYDVFPPDSWQWQTFSDYINLWQYVGYSPSTSHVEINQFANLCSSFGQECLYSPSTYSCVEESTYSTQFDLYFDIVVIMNIIFMLKELCKLSTIIYCMCIKNCPRHLRTFVRGSVFAPMLVFRLQSFRKDIIEHVSSYRDILFSMLYDTFLENIGQLAMYMYFILVVEDSGFSLWNLLTLPSNLSSVATKLFLLYRLHVRNSNLKHTVPTFFPAEPIPLADLTKKQADKADEVNSPGQTTKH